VLPTPALTPHFIQILVLVRIPAGITHFSLFQNVQTDPGAYRGSSQYVPGFSVSQAAGAWSWPLTTV